MRSYINKQQTSVSQSGPGKMVFFFFFLEKELCHTEINVALHTAIHPHKLDATVEYIIKAVRQRMLLNCRLPSQRQSEQWMEKGDGEHVVLALIMFPSLPQDSPLQPHGV